MTDEKEYCPRAIEEGRGPGSVFLPPFNGEMEWRHRPLLPATVMKASAPVADDLIVPTARTCSYCGSLHPDDLFDFIARGAELGPTDKSYKMYVRMQGFNGKFYFQHFNRDQQLRFIEVINSRSAKIGPPGHFYTTPFFCQRGKPTSGT